MTNSISDAVRCSVRLMLVIGSVQRGKSEWGEVIGGYENTRASSRRYYNYCWL